MSHVMLQTLVALPRATISFLRSHSRAPSFSAAFICFCLVCWQNLQVSFAWSWTDRSGDRPPPWHYLQVRSARHQKCTPTAVLQPEPAQANLRREGDRLKSEVHGDLLNELKAAMAKNMAHALPKGRKELLKTAASERRHRVDPAGPYAGEVSVRLLVCWPMMVIFNNFPSISPIRMAVSHNSEACGKASTLHLFVELCRQRTLCGGDWEANCGLGWESQETQHVLAGCVT